MSSEKPNWWKQTQLTGKIETTCAAGDVFTTKLLWDYFEHRTVKVEGSYESHP